MLILTIDSGTSNTRAKLWQDGRLLAKSFAAVGVRDTVITGSRQKLQMGVRQAMLAAAQTAGIDIREVGLILASGMITSNVGLCEVPHVLAPAGIKELARGLAMSRIEAVVEQPFWFVPGIKNNVAAVDLNTYEAMDIMRGEEVETFGLIEQLKLQGPAIFVLPGSHSKFISLDAGNRVTACLTTLAGELLDIITGHTILAGALGRSFAQEFDRTHVAGGSPLRQPCRPRPGVLFGAYPGAVQRHRCQSASQLPAGRGAHNRPYGAQKQQRHAVESGHPYRHYWQESDEASPQNACP